MPTCLVRAAFAFWVVPLALPACGGKSFESGGDEPNGGTTTGATGGGGSSSHGGSAAGGKAQGGSNSGGSGTGGGAMGGSAVGGSGVGGSSQCDAFLNEPGSTVMVQITNETMLPIYLGQEMLGCGVGALFSVVDAAGAPLLSPGFCTTTCQDVMQGTIVGCPPIACIVGSAITLLPGESANQQWSGAFMLGATLPAACRPADGSNECQRIAGVKPGAFTFSAQAGTQLDCSRFADGVCQPCMPDANGGCTTPGALIAGPLLSAQVKVMLDASYGVGGPGGGGMTRAVELVFKN